ncbi:hypothetical protein FKM82_016115 [Ascaphus truei]|uniref:bcl-2-binding component 3 n=1 Tax=Ascaphus truei TaxID=8439 RepID=UPI003F5AB02A
MARPLHDGSASEPAGSIQAEGTRSFPSGGVGGEPSRGICEQNLPLSRRAGPSSPAPSCQRCSSPRINHCRPRHGLASDCEGSGPSCSLPCEQRHCHFPESFTTGETTAYGLRPTEREYSGMEERVAVDQNRVGVVARPRGELPLVGEEAIDREIAIRLRRIGDQMNELYLQRRLAGERQWMGPLRWHLNQFISEILAALYNPLVDLLP